MPDTGSWELLAVNWWWWWWGEGMALANAVQTQGQETRCFCNFAPGQGTPDVLPGHLQMVASLCDCIIWAGLPAWQAVLVPLEPCILWSSHLIDQGGSTAMTRLWLSLTSAASSLRTGKVLSTIVFPAPSTTPVPVRLSQRSSNVTTQ